MDSWTEFNETSLPNREVFHSSINIEDIANLIMSMQKICGLLLKLNF